MTQQAIISTQDRAQLKRTLRKDLKGEVKLNLFTQRPSVIAVPGRECPSCPQAQQLMEELAALSSKLRLETRDFYAEPEAARKYGVARIPALVLGRDDSAGIKFYGVPQGYLLSALLEDIKTISRGVSPLSMDSRRGLRRVNQPVHLQVFVAPNDPASAGMARLAHALPLENPNLTADVIAAQEFTNLARNYNVRSVPLTVINEYTSLSGPVREAELVDKVLQAGVRETSSGETSGS